MSEFTKVLDRIHENLQNGQPMFDGIEYLFEDKQNNVGPEWRQPTCLDDRIDRYRVKPVITGMFDAESVVELFNKHSRGIGYSAGNLFNQDLADSLNEFVESKLPALREQAVRDFIERMAEDIKPRLYDELDSMIIYLQGSGNPSNKPEGQLVKGPERGEPKPANGQTITLKIPESAAPVPSDFPAPAPVMPEQRITIQPGDYMPHELITNEAVFNLVIKAFSAALDKSTFSFLNYRGWQEGKSSLNKGIGITSDREEITNLSISAKRKLTLQQLLNATNGFEWPEGADTIMYCLGRIEFTDSKTPQAPMPGYKILATRVK